MAKTKKIAAKTTSKAKTKVTKINAGGGIMVDVVEKVEKASKPTNPFRAFGGYWASVEALRTLGVGKMHSFDEIVPAVRKAMGSGYKEFKAKDARNENGKDADARILQNVSVVARKDYGAPLREIGFEVRWDGRQKVAGIFKIGK